VKIAKWQRNGGGHLTAAAVMCSGNKYGGEMAIDETWP